MRWIVRLLLFAAIAGVLGRDVQQRLFEPLPLKKNLVVNVPKGANLNSLLRDLQPLGIFDSNRQRWYLALYARMTGEARAIKAGEYEFVPGMRAIDVTALMVSGHVVLHELRLVEGWRFDEVLEAVRHDERLAHAQGPTDGAALMKALGHEGLSPEGRFYPDTYRFPRGTSELAFLRRALDTLDGVLAEEWAARAEDTPYRTPEGALIMASIVERETAAPEERAQIAAVFVRRLSRGMRLQTDPTVIYGLGAAFDGNLRKRDLLADTPYNTYTRAGLPPTPICLPSRAALHAALHPAPGKALYFVARQNGTHQFSETLAEHEAAVRKYQLRHGK